MTNASDSNRDHLPHIVIIGGGFGGLYAARALRKVPARITLIDRRNHHLFQPLLYQVATAALNPSDIAAPIRSVLRKQRNVTVLLEEATAIDRRGRRVILRSGELAYDFLIVASGATHSYFGHETWRTNAPGLKTVEDALAIRRRILLAYEAAERESDAEKRVEWLTFIVVGGGPTGVELAGALAEIARKTMARDFRHFNPADARVILIEGTDRLLPSYPSALSLRAARQLEKLGVEVWTGRQVVDVQADAVVVGEERIPCRTTLWAAGVKASTLGAKLDAPLDRNGRVLVNPDLSVADSPEVFAIGDLAAFNDRGKLVPGVAPAAIQQGRHAAANIRRMLRGEAALPFHYSDKGSLATIGRGSGVADFGSIGLSGGLAWLAWLLIHVFFLIGFRNRFLVIFQWAWAYVTYQRSARLITFDAAHPED